MNQPAVSVQTDSPRVPELDGIRGIAILLVILWHYAGSIIAPQTSWLGDLVIAVTATAWSGVDLFFVLSGFLIGGILLDNSRAPNYFKAFYARRVSRIFPLYFLWLALFVSFTWGLPQLAWTPPLAALFGNPMPLWTYLTFTQNFAMASNLTTGPHWLGITWSLAIEEQFYATLPLAIRFISFARLPLFLIFFILMAPVFRLLFLALTVDIYSSSLLLPSRADSLMLGVLCAYAMRQERWVSFIQKHTRLLYGAFIMLMAGVAFLTILAPSTTAPHMAVWGYSVLALFYACFLLLAVTKPDGIVASITRNRFLRRMGILAYGLYIFHQAVLWLVNALILHQAPRIQTVADVLVMLIAFATVLLIASASWSLFERKFIALGHQVKYSSPVPIGGSLVHAGQ